MDSKSEDAKKSKAGDGTNAEGPRDTVFHNVEGGAGTHFLGLTAPAKKSLDKTSVGEFDITSSHEHSGVKKLYEGPKKCECCINWVDERRADIEENLNRLIDSQQHGLIVRMKNGHGGERPLTLDSIIIQGAELRHLLSELFEGYEGITTTLEKLVFNAPFQPFFHEWQRLNDLLKTPVYKENKQAWALQDILQTELGEAIHEHQDLIRNGVITFEYLWTIFKLGQVCLAGAGNDILMLRAMKAEYATICSERCFVVTGWYIDFDGTQFGYAKTARIIRPFSGTKALADLEITPNQFHPLSKEQQTHLQARGAKFRQLLQMPYNHVEYDGVGITTAKIQRKIRERVMVDTASYQAQNPPPVEILKPLGDALVRPSLDIGEVSHHDEAGTPHGASEHGSDPVGTTSSNRYRRRARRVAPSCTDYTGTQMPQSTPKAPIRTRPHVDDDLLYLCGPIVRGYCLTSKQWMQFYVDSFDDICWNRDVFHCLVLNDDVKRLIVALVESHAADKDKFDDVITGKGRGVIMLLEGSPGVGKTLAAEAIAESLERPLYMMSAGELTSSPYGLERALDLILKLAAKWSAILLLDECHVFLEKRSLNDLARNSSVAIFLRLLEYYAGILLMTTNRVETIDPAFESRIHLTIQYPKLDQDAQTRVWKMFLGANCPDNEVNAEDMKFLTRLNLNGREIKNLVKIAHLLASHEQSVLSIEHFRSVLRATKKLGPEIFGGENNAELYD